MSDYFTSPGHAIAARRALELEWEKKLWRMLQTGMFHDQRWYEVGLTLQQVLDARAGVTSRAAYRTLVPWVRLTASAEFNRRQLKAAPAGAQKRWVARMDDRTRPEHRYLHGKTEALGQPFRVNYDHIYYPGDRGAPLYLTAGCRCTLVIVDSS